MTVTLKADIQVATPDLRNALRAVLPLANPLVTGDHDAEHRVRLAFVERWLFVIASNGSGTALAKVAVHQDSRKIDFTAEDGPIIVDLTPRRARLILQQFKAKPSDPDVGQLMEFGIDIEDETFTVSDIGGLWSEGESNRYPIEEPSDSFPDVIRITAQALAGIGATQVGKPLVTDGAVLRLFQPASKVYDQPLQIEATGSADSRGFTVSCGPDFLGTLSSTHQDDDSLKKRDRYRMSWLELIPAQKLQAV
jgi:hypothetical protein